MQVMLQDTKVLTQQSKALRVLRVLRVLQVMLQDTKVLVQAFKVLQARKVLRDT